MHILWLSRAVADVDGLIDDTLERDPHAAVRVAAVLREQVSRLAEHPGLGRPGRVADTRELVTSGPCYSVAYTVDVLVDAVIVLRVLRETGRRPESP